MSSIEPKSALSEIIDKKLTTPEFASSLKVSPQTVRKNYCLSGHCYGIKPIKIGNRLLWSASQVSKLLAGAA
jgi:hypothetical protein